MKKRVVKSVAVLLACVFLIAGPVVLTMAANFVTVAASGNGPDPAMIPPVQDPRR